MPEAVEEVHTMEPVAQAALEVVETALFIQAMTIQHFLVA
jgi:hypothetical protein